MILTVLDKGRAVEFILPGKISGKHIINTIDENGINKALIAIEEQDGKWYLKSNKNAFLKNIKNEKVLKIQVEINNVYTIYKNNGESVLLYAQLNETETNKFSKYFATKDIVKIGRSNDCGICFANKLVSSNHCEIRYYENEEAVVKDTGSLNGTYVNGIRVKEKKLNKGDVLYIMGLKIVFNGRLIAFNNPNGKVYLDKFLFNEFKPQKSDITEEIILEDFEKKEDDKNIFYKSPRFKNDIETVEFKIDPPPSVPYKEETPIMLLLGPSITMGMTSLFTAGITLQNVIRTGGDIMNAMPTLIMSFSMLMGTVLWPILTKKHEKKKRIAFEKVRQAKYKEYIEKVREDIKEESERQSKILHTNNITINECVRRIEGSDRTLWERTNNHNDFLKVRLGIGDLPLNARFKYPEKKFTIEEDNLVDELYSLVDEDKTLNNVPVTLSLLDEKVSGIIGNREYGIELLKNVLFQLTALHGYDELKLVFIYDDEEASQWEFIKWIPHVWSDDKSIRFIGKNSKDVKELSSYFEKEISRRLELEDKELKEQTPHYIVFSMSKKLAVKAEMISSILRSKKNIGFTIVALYDELKDLPKECSKVIEITDDISKVYDKDDISGKYTKFKMDDLVHVDEKALAVDLANIKLDTSSEKYSLPEMLTFLEMFKVGKVEHLNLLSRWKENDPTKTIETEIGVDTMGEAFKLDLHEKYHGPHGLIAGMTGSGKSEFIMTFILSLAVNYHPDEVAFILIDYKGGGMAHAFTDLPHLAGTITNLDGAAVKRSLVSIQSELKRRQAIFNEAGKNLGISNIDIYKYQKLYRDGKVSEPLQHLFMISDEFAELKTQQPEFMEQLVSAARIGRSLGVHLILATQKPAGVVDDQIWSNSKFRIALKVQEKADSMDVIKRPDAAELSTTGRFYLQVGFNELFELGQSAWGGAPYYPSDKVEVKKDDTISVIDNLGRVIKSGRIDKRKDIDINPLKQLDVITKYIANIANEEGIKVKPLWLEPIPEFIYVDELKKKYNKLESKKHYLEPVIGEYDDPENQAQHVLTLSISREGNTIVYGSAGNGKTTFITSLMYSLMESHTPDELNMYVLDFASETLKAFEKSPHVGDVLLSNDNEKVDNLFKMLYSEVDKRKKLFADFGGDYQSYIKNSGKSIESLVLIIHNFAAFTEMFEDHEDTVAYLSREGTKYGIYFVVTALSSNSVRYRLLQNFKQLLVLQLNDEGDYSAVLGNTDGVIPSKIKGRGIIKNGKTYEFQTAYATKDVENTFEFIREYCSKVRNSYGKSGAKRIPILPKKVDVDYLKDELKYLDRSKIPVGIEKESLSLTNYDFNKDFISLVLSKEDEGIDFVQGIAEVISELKEEVIVIDAESGFVYDSNKKYRYINNSSDFENIIVELFNTVVTRHNTIKDAKNLGEEIPRYNKIKCVITSINKLKEKLSADGIEKLNLFLANGQSSYNINFILVDKVEGISGISYENWFRNHVNLSNGIWCGNGISEQYQLKISNMTSSMYKDIDKGFGYILSSGKVKLVKLLSSKYTREEEE